MNATNEELTRIYNEANGIDRKNPPITTERIFAAMRLAMRKQAEKDAEICDDMDVAYIPCECADAIRKSWGNAE